MEDNQQLQPNKLTAEAIERICRTQLPAILQLNLHIVESLKRPDEALLFLAEQDRQIRLLTAALRSIT
jgi:hypothetical protein